MTTLRVLLSRLADLVTRGRREARLAQEVETHLQLLAEEYARRGMSPAEARLAARRAFGGVDQVKELYRDQRGLPFVETFLQDIRFGARLLARDRGFTLTAVLVLGLGIGVNNMFFTLVYGHTLRGLPIERAERVLYVSTLDTRGGDRGFSYPDFDDLRAAARSFTGVAAFANASMSVGDQGRAPDRFEGTYLSANAFALIGATPVLGRPFTPGDDRPGAAPVAMLSHTAWRARYGGDGAILFRSIMINGSPATVIAVMPDRSGFPSTADVWQPVSLMPGLDHSQRDARTLRVLGRLRDGVGMTDARREVESIVDRGAREHPGTNSGLRARVVPINERYFGQLTNPAWLAFITASCLIVVISCANVANLMLARSVRRAREIAIRSSLGAGRRRIVGQLLVECAVLAVLGAVVGLGFALAGVQIFKTAIPDSVLPYWVHYSVDARVVAALVAVSVIAVFVFGLVPSLQTSRTDVNRVLKDGGRTGIGGRYAPGWTTAFLTAEFALTVVMLAQLALSIRLDRATPPTDLAIHTRDVLTAAITVPIARAAHGLLSPSRGAPRRARGCDVGDGREPPAPFGRHRAAPRSGWSNARSRRRLALCLDTGHRAQILRDIGRCADTRTRLRRKRRQCRRGARDRQRTIRRDVLRRGESHRPAHCARCREHAGTETRMAHHHRCLSGNSPAARPRSRSRRLPALPSRPTRNGRAPGAQPKRPWLHRIPAARRGIGSRPSFALVSHDDDGAGVRRCAVEPARLEQAGVHP